MRYFIVIGKNTITNADFNLNDLCGATGRLDILLRCVNSAFFLSNNIRKDVELFLILQNKRTIRLVGKELKYLNPDERSSASLFLYL